MKLTPFKRWTIENFPFIEADFDAITNYQLYCKIVEYLNKVIDSQNTVIAEVDEMKKYLDNLDIQELVNNKLDEMAESGQLTDIIAQYLDLAGVLAYNTIAELKNATNIVAGSICYTLGQNSYNDGKGAFYKIRAVTTSDVVDNFNIVSITNDNTIVGERIPNYLENEVNNLNRLINKKCIFIGDSYGEGYTPTESVTGWPTLIINKLGLQNSIIKVYGGTGFVNTVDNKNFITLLNEIDADSNVTDIIVCGGFNDTSHIGDIEAGITSFKNIANTKFPNAKIHVGAIGWSNDQNKFYNLARTIAQYIESSKKLGLHYLSNVEYSLHEYGYVFSSDGIHPNQNGQNNIADNVAHAFIYGSCDVIRPYTNIVPINKNSLTETITETLGCTLNNGLIEVSMQRGGDIVFASPQSFSGRSGINIRLFDIETSENEYSYIIGNNYHYNKVYVPVIIATSDSKYYNAMASFIFEGGSVYLDIKGLINDSHNNYLSVNIQRIQVLSGFTFSCDALMC